MNSVNCVVTTIQRTTAGHTPVLRIPAVLRPEHVQRPGDGNVAELLKPPLLPPGGYDPTARAAQWLVRFNDDRPPTGSAGAGNDAGVGQVEKDGGNVG